MQEILIITMAFLLGVAVGGLLEKLVQALFGTKEVTPSASYNSASTQLKCVSCGSIVPSSSIQKHTGLCSLCNPPF